MRGNLLVPSKIPGVAMAGRFLCFREGVVIGKALESHDGDGVDRIWMEIMLR
jgi:hypothetical protein